MSKFFRKANLGILALTFLVTCHLAYGELIAPDFTLTDIDGNTFSLSDFQGTIVILNFFASYCPPCQEEMSQLKIVKNEFGGKLEIISLSMWSGDTDETLKQFREDYDITWILARDTEGLYGKYKQVTGNPWGIPALYTIDQNGYIRYYHKGETEASVIIEEIKEILSPDISVYTDEYSYAAGETMYLGINITNPDSEQVVCFAVWVVRPGGSIYVYIHMHDIVLPADLTYSNPTFRTIILPNPPLGTYVWHAALLNPATHEIIVEDTAEWQFS